MVRTSIHAFGRDDHMSAAETKRREQFEALIRVGYRFAHEVLAGNAKVSSARGKPRPISEADR